MNRTKKEKPNDDYQYEIDQDFSNKEIRIVIEIEESVSIKANNLYGDYSYMCVFINIKDSSLLVEGSVIQMTSEYGKNCNLEYTYKTREIETEDIEAKANDQYDSNGLNLENAVRCKRPSLVEKNMEICTDRDNESFDSKHLFFKGVPKEFLTAEEERECAIAIENGDQSGKERLVLHNQLLVASIARIYINNGLSYYDLCQEGYLGLIRAAELFDIRKECRFSTYASFWIKQSIMRALANTGRSIRLPVHIVEKISKLKRITEDFEKKTGRIPTSAEIANELDIKIEEVELLQLVIQDVVSFDVPVGEKGDTLLKDFIADDNSPSIEEELDYKMLKRYINEALTNVLSEKEQKVLTLRFGLENGIPCTLETIGKTLGVTKERVRQIQICALHKLRKSSYGKKLIDYL